MAMHPELFKKIHELEEMGLVDGYLELMYQMKEGYEDERYFEKLLSEFLEDANLVLDKMASICLKDDNVKPDFHSLREACIRLKGSSGNIGAMHIADACVKLRETTVSSSSQERCVEGFFRVRRTFEDVRDHFSNLIQMERDLISNNNVVEDAASADGVDDAAATSDAVEDAGASTLYAIKDAMLQLQI